MENSIVLYDSDVFYAKRFMEYFKKKKDYNFIISVLTNKDSLDEFLQTHTVEILIVGDQIKPEDILANNIKYIYQLTDPSKTVINADYTEINKYQSAQSVMQEIMKDYYSKEKDSLVMTPSSTVKIISILDPKPAFEILAFAWAVSSLISEQKKALVVILDPLPVQILSVIDNTSTALTEFIYYLKEYPHIIMKMKNQARLIGDLSYLSGISHGTDILSLNRADINKWVKELRVNSDYQTVIFYLGGYTEAMLELPGLSDLIIIPGATASYDKALLTCLTRQIELCGVELKQDKIIKVNLEEETKLGQVPISVSELSNTLAWSYAVENLKLII